MITIDDKHRLEDFNMQATEEYYDSVSFPFTDNTLQVPRNNITVLVNERAEPRMLTIPIKVRNNGHTDLESKLQSFTDLFFDDYGERKQVKVSLDHWQDKFVNAYIATNLDTDRLRGLAHLDLELICYDPYRYSGTLASDVVWGAESITFTSHYEMGHEGTPSSVDITGSGTSTIDLTVDGIAVYPKIIIEGSSEALTLSVHGETIQLPAFSNSKWEIGRFKTFKDGKETFLNARRFRLVRGINAVRISGNNKNFKLTITFRDMYK